MIIKRLRFMIKLFEKLIIVFVCVNLLIMFLFFYPIPIRLRAVKRDLSGLQNTDPAKFSITICTNILIALETQGKISLIAHYNTGSMFKISRSPGHAREVLSFVKAIPGSYPLLLILSAYKYNL